jgi:hypothetical protein
MVSDLSIVGRWCFPDGSSPVGRIEPADSAGLSGRFREAADSVSLPVRQRGSARSGKSSTAHVYDAGYLELARRIEVPLATLEREARSAAASKGWHWSEPEGLGRRAKEERCGGARSAS